MITILALFREMNGGNLVQSVALAGTLSSPGVNVSVDEQALVDAGYTGKLEDLPITIERWDFDATAKKFAYGGTGTMYRVAYGVWAGGADAPTVAGGASTACQYLVRLGSDVTKTYVDPATGRTIQEVIASATRTQAIAVAAKFTRASS